MSIFELLTARAYLDVSLFSLNFRFQIWKWNNSNISYCKSNIVRLIFYIQYKLATAIRRQHCLLNCCYDPTQMSLKHARGLSWTEFFSNLISFPSIFSFLCFSLIRICDFNIDCANLEIERGCNRYFWQLCKMSEFVSI